MQKDNLFDGKFTFLDFVKICLLIVTAFSTWNVVDIITPDGGFSFVREIAALLVVEGAFLAFEKATSDAKSKKQMRISTVGFAISLAVIVLFAATSGLLEFGGQTLMNQPAGSFLGLAWTARDVTTVAALMTLVIWIATLAALQRYYNLENPEKKLEISRIEANGKQGEEDITALNHALNKTKGTVAKHRALAAVKKSYTGELTPDELAALIADAEGELATQYGTPIAVNSEMPFVPRNESGLIERQPVHTFQPKAAPTIPMAKAEQPVGFPVKPTLRDETTALNQWSERRANKSQAPDATTVLEIIESGDCTAPAEAFTENHSPEINDLVGQVNGASGVGLPCFQRGFIEKDASITAACGICGFNKGASRDDGRIALLTALAAKVRAE